MRALNKVAPVCVGGMEGSGTRVIAWLVEDLGVDMQPALFEMSFKPYDDFCGLRHVRYLKTRFQNCEDRERGVLHEAVNKHPKCEKNPKWKWGMKSPRSLALFPWLSKQMPNAKFVHILRFPGDVRFGRQKNYVNWFKWMTPEDMEFEQAYFYVWCQLNGMVYEYCSTKLRDRYLCVREEDLFFHKKRMVQNLVDFLGSSTAYTWDELRHPKPRNSIGRFARDGGTIPEFAKPTLQRFGYKTGMEREAKARPWCDNEQSQRRAVGAGSG